MQNGLWHTYPVGKERTGFTGGGSAFESWVAISIYRITCFPQLVKFDHWRRDTEIHVRPSCQSEKCFQPLFLDFPILQNEIFRLRNLCGKIVRFGSFQVHRVAARPAVKTSREIDSVVANPLVEKIVETQFFLDGTR
jgi:hypothetical protein